MSPNTRSLSHILLAAAVAVVALVAPQTSANAAPAAEVSIDAASLVVDEGGDIVVEVHLDVAQSDDVVVNLGVTLGTASPGDVDLSGWPGDKLDLTIPKGDIVATVQVPVLEDFIHPEGDANGDETVKFDILEIDSGPATVGSPATVIVDVRDVPPPFVGMRINSNGSIITDEGDNVAVDIFLDKAANSPVTVDVEFAGLINSTSTNIASRDDFDLTGWNDTGTVPTRTITIPTGTLSVTLTIPTTEDLITPEPTTTSTGETFGLNLNNVTGGAIFDPSNSSNPGLAMRVRDVPPPGPAAPAAPTAALGQVSGSGSISWSAPSTNGSPITGYRIEQSINGGAWTVVVADTGNTATTRNLTGLTLGSYRFRVGGINANGGGLSPASNEITPLPPVTVTIAPAPGQQNPTTGASVQFQATFSQAVTGLTANDVIIGGTANPTTRTVSGSGTAYTITVTGMTDDGTATAMIAANSVSSTGGQGNTASSTATVTYDHPGPLAPATPVATLGSPDTSATLEWTTPGDNGRPITGYRIEQSVNGGAFTVVVADTGLLATVRVISGLERDVVHQFRVAGINSNGAGTASAPSNAVRPPADLSDVDFVVPLTPARFLETRSGPRDRTIDGQFEGIGALPARQILELQITGRDNVPATGVSAVVMNLTAISPTERRFITAFPCNGTPPNASSLNYSPGAVVANELVAKLDSQGRVCLFTLRTTDAIVDITGYIPS